MKSGKSNRTTRSADPRTIAVVILLAALSVLLNTYGIKWGLPDGEHFHPSLHPDETASLESSMLILSTEKPLFPSPTGLGNGPMQFYVAALVYEVLYGRGLQSTLDRLTGPKLAQLYTVGRILTVVMSAGCALLVFFAGRSIFNFTTGLVAGLFFVVLPATVTNSHYFRPDIPTTLWLLFAFVAGARLLKSGSRTWYILGGLAAGFATATKYNSVLIIIPLLYAHIHWQLKNSKKKRWGRLLGLNLLLAVIFFLAAYALSAPGTFLYWDVFKERVVRQFQYQTSHAFMDTMDLGSGWGGYLTRILPYSLGLPMLLLALAGAAYSLVRRTKPDLMLILLILPYYLMIGRSDWWVVRYTVPLMPFMALLAARLVVELHQKATRAYLKLIPAAVGAMVFLFTLFYSIELDRIMAAPDPRHQAYDWINENVAGPKVVGFDFLPQAFFPGVDQQRHATQYMQMNPANLDKIDYYVANDQIYLQFLRLSHRYPNQAQYFRTILKSDRFAVAVRFENPFNLAGIRFPKANIPHDYLYFMPRIEIYQNLAKP